MDKVSSRSAPTTRAELGRAVFKRFASASASTNDWRACKMTRVPAAWRATTMAAPTRRAAPVTRITGAVVVGKDRAFDMTRIVACAILTLYHHFY